MQTVSCFVFLLTLLVLQLLRVTSTILTKLMHSWAKWLLTAVFAPYIARPDALWPSVLLETLLLWLGTIKDQSAGTLDGIGPFGSVWWPDREGSWSSFTERGRRTVWSPHQAERNRVMQHDRRNTWQVDHENITCVPSREINGLL